MTEYLDTYYGDTATRFWSPDQEMPRCRSRKLLQAIEDTGLRYPRVLEYGYGSGWLLYRLAQRYAEVAGWEYNEKVERPVREFLDKSKVTNVRLHSSAGGTFEEFIARERGGFDLLVAEAVIEHVVDLYGTVDSLRALLRPGGHFCIMLPNVAYLKTRIELLLGRFPRTGSSSPISEWRSAGWDGNHLHVFTQDSMTTLLADCGFDVMRYYGWGARLRAMDSLRDWRPSLFSGALIAMCKKRQ